MLQIIGLMLGAYMITRMVELLAKPDGAVVVKVFAILTALFTLFSIFALLMTGSGPTPRPY